MCNHDRIHSAPRQGSTAQRTPRRLTTVEGNITTITGASAANNKQHTRLNMPTLNVTGTAMPYPMRRYWARTRQTADCPNRLRIRAQCRGKIPRKIDVSLQRDALSRGQPKHGARWRSQLHNGNGLYECQGLCSRNTHAQGHNVFRHQSRDFDNFECTIRCDYVE